MSDRDQQIIAAIVDKFSADPYGDGQMAEAVAEALRQVRAEGDLPEVYDSKAGLLQRLEVAEADLVSLRAQLAEAQRAYSPCHAHQPARWEGDGSCVICEGQQVAARVSVLEEFTERVVITFRNYYGGAISRAEVDAILAEWLALKSAALAPSSPPETP